MRLIEIFESRTKKATLPPPRNPVAKNAKRTGAGAHETNKFNRKVKHKNKPQED